MSPAGEADVTSLRDEGRKRAIDLLRRCAAREGFLATPAVRANYRRVWGRDGCIVGLAALLTEDEGLVLACRRTLETLAGNQGPHGEIPSNVDPVSGRVSYGGTAGRVDSDLWFLIAGVGYWKATGDDDFLERMYEPMERVRALLGAWEFNDRGLLYVPATGDWADEYLQSGYVLYDQLLYLRAQREMADVHVHVHGGEDHALAERIGRLRRLIRGNYWMCGDDTDPDDVYHEVLYKKGREAAPGSCGDHWLPFFTPGGYGYRFDGFANVLAALFGVGDPDRDRSVDALIREELASAELPLVPAFHPVITPRDEDWDDLQMRFSYTFKNEPWQYHNGGLWPMITGFHVASLAGRGHEEEARWFLDGLLRANAAEMEGEPWSFPEYVHGKELTPGGGRHMAWSAAAVVFGDHALAGGHVLRDGETP